MTMTVAGSLAAAALFAANDNARFRGGYPALTWLTKKDKPAAREVWRRICDARQQTNSEADGFNPTGYSPDDAEHSVPDVELTSETMSEPVADGPDEVWTEALHEIKPGIHTMLRCAGGVAWPWCGVREKRAGKVIWHGEPWQYFYCLLPLVDGHSTLLGGLTFYTAPGARKLAEGGMLVIYADAKGNVQRPAYTTSMPRGGKRPRRTKAAAKAYLALPAAIASPLRVEGHQRPMSDAPALIPMLTPLMRREPGKGLDIYGQVDKLGRFGVAEARAMLEWHYANDNLPLVTKCPTVVAKGAWFLGGISSTKETASAPAPLWHYPDPPLSPVLEEVAARGDLADIGEVARDKTKAPPVRLDRLGKKALLAVGKALVAANDNYLKKVAA